MIADDWCAKVYEKIDYSGWELKLPETSQGSLHGTDKDNEVSAVKIRSGCTLKGYDGHGLHDLIFTFTKDDPRLFMKSGQNDKMTSYKCSCQAQGKIGFNLDFILNNYDTITNKSRKISIIIFSLIYHIKTDCRFFNGSRLTK